jgi:hypothetical protein
MPNFKNRAEREAWVKDYKNWKLDDGRAMDIWKSVPELALNFYRYDFANGAALVATEYNYWNGYTNECQRRRRFCLVLPEHDACVDKSSVCGEEWHRTYTLEGCSLGTVVDYLTKHRDDL